MELSIRGSISMERSMGKELSIGVTSRYILVNFITTTFTAKDFTFGMMVASMRVTGNSIRWMEWAPSPGRMAENTLVNMWKIKSKVKASSFGLMVDTTLVAGSMGNSMVKESIQPRKESQDRESGSKEKGPSGCEDLRGKVICK